MNTAVPPDVGWETAVSNSNFMPKLNYRLLFWVNVVFIIVASLVPSSVHSVWHLDKVGHFAAYCALFTFGLFTFQTPSIRKIVFLLSVGLGATMEWLQSYIPGREMSLLDGLTNIAGLLFGIVVYRTLKPMFDGQKRPFEKSR